MNNQPGIINRVMTTLWDTINFFRRFIVNILFVGILIMVLSLMFSDSDTVELAQSNALVLDLAGDIVEQKKYQTPTSVFLNDSMSQSSNETEVLLSDIVLVINHAATNPKINLIVLKLTAMQSSGLNKLVEIGDALEQFKANGKQVIAVADYYSQSQYYLASYADEIIMNPMGAVLIEGFASYHLYFKEALEKLKITQHIFKVGKFKSAVEPYSRDDMSDAAKEANLAWLGDVWLKFKNDIAARRQMDIANFDESLDTILHKLTEVQGDFGQYALDNRWVDTLKSREQIRQQLIGLVGENPTHDFNQVSFNEYLDLVKPPFVIDNPMINKVAVIIAKGTIQDGYRKAGDIGGDSTAELLRKARLDDAVKAVVLRVDSPGGSAFASEIIRKEVEALKLAGKPVVASMSSVAASGGYWISTAANEIWASPTTITGSIGIFGLFMTFENSIKTLGITSDGVATTELAGLSMLRPLAPKFGDIIQLNIEKGYQRFLTLVAQSRNMTVEQVDEIAQGRVWTGAMAHKLGLVDHLGDFNDAVNAAAGLASLDVFETKLIEEDVSARDKFIQQMLGDSHGVVNSHINDKSMVGLMNYIQKQLSQVQQFNDPQHVYVHCQVCDIY